MTQTAFTTTDEMTPLECFDWLVAVYVDRGFPARPDSPAGLRVAKVRSALNPAKPRRNEPVGVTISRELAEDIHEALEDLGACPDDECTQCRRVLPRLSASITGEKG